MNQRSAAALALFAIFGCKPAVRGLCSSTADCRQGAYCSLDGICLASSGTCSPACGDGEICSGSTCAALKPVIAVQPPSGPISPAFPQITVHVDAASAIALHGVSVEVDSSASAVASGSLAAPQAGDNLVTLTQITAGTVGAVSVRATLRYQPAGAAVESTVSSVAVPANIDAAPPTVSVFVPPAADAINGWVPRTSANLEVRANVDDGAGSGPQSATLSFDACPAALSCTYPGTLVSQAQGAAVFSFQVPRMAQSPGSEAPLAVTVTGTDFAGNAGQGAGKLQIDAAPPQIGAYKLISTTGVVGEDGQTWFIGGSGAPDVEIAVPVTDNGAGFSSLLLHLDATDLYGGFPTASLDVTGTLKADGVHFLLPANGVRGKEQHLRFTLTASDLLKNTGSLGPDDPKTMIWVDAASPTLTAPHVVYSSALPSSACGPTGVVCGRQNSTHVLADDSVTVTYAAYDCGVGMAGPQSATVKTAVSSPPGVATAETFQDGSPCSGINGSTNKTHHYAFTLDLAALSLVLDPPLDPTGTSLVRLTANGQDRLQQPSSAGPGSATSGDGLALVSLWRWRNQVAGVNTPPSGSPALLPGTAGARQIAVATSLTGGTAPNFFVLKPDGSSSWSATTSGQSLAGDVAVGPSGKIYAVGPSTMATCSGSGCNAVLEIIVPPSSGGTGTAEPCVVSNVSFGSPPALVTDNGVERAVVPSNGHAPGAAGNVFLFHESSGCLDSPAVVGIGDYAGITASWPTIFLANSGFTSIDYLSGGTFNTTTQRLYSGTAPSSTPPSVAPPVTSPTDTAPRAFFGSSDLKLRSAMQASSPCTTGTTDTAGTCWVDDPAFPSANPLHPVPATPVFDSAWVYAADDHAVVYGFPRATGVSSWSKDLRSSTALPSAWPPSPSGATLAPPVLLQGETVLVVRSDGVVVLASATGLVPLLLVNAISVPVAPVVDAHGTGSVAYVADGNGFVWALQIAAPPLAAGSNAWPRPGRDSCNSRNATSSCQ